jgi:hypothetical protein
MCIKHIKKYTQCPHTGVKIEHCEIYKANPEACHNKEKRPETINGHCRKCGGGPQPEPIITYVDFETISSWNRESASSIEKPSSLDSGVELMRKGSQKAVGGVKRFIGSIRSNRSSGGSSSLLDAVSETESPSRGENTASYPSTIEPLTESKAVNTSTTHAKRWQRPTESSSGHILSSSNTNGGMHETQPSHGRGIETASVVTTWTKIIEKAGGIQDSGRAKISQDDGVLYQQEVDVSLFNVVISQSRREELAKAGERLARVRDGRGYINFNVV